MFINVSLYVKNSNERKIYPDFKPSFVAFYGFFVAWLYWAAPKNLEEVSIKAKETIENAATKGQIIIGTYEVDQAKFSEGLKAFRRR